MFMLEKKFILLNLIMFLFRSVSGISTPDDLSFSRYISLLERINVKGWEMDKDNTVDEDGILMVKNKYHPLAICQYGMLCYYEFIDKGDPEYLRKLSEQVNYFRDTTKIHVLDGGRAIGLPYTFNFHDMKSPWYSGMTQGYAVSLLLRYYDLTKDITLIDIIKKIARLLVIPEDRGGTLGITPEGFTMIQEYPCSEKDPFVLNGFINGLIGIYEYCQVFPEDTTACRVRDECLYALKESVHLYDQPKWTSYDRASKKVSNKYLRYQIHEMKHLYVLTGDEFFRRQMMLWSSFLNAPDKSRNPRFILNDFNYAVKCVNKDSLLFPDLSFHSLLDSIDFNIVAGVKNPRPVPHDTNEAEGQGIKFHYVPQKKKEKYKIEMAIEFPEPLVFDQAFFTTNPPLDERVEIYASYQDDLEKAFTKARPVSHTTCGQKTFLDLGEMMTSSIRFMLKTKDPRETWTFSNLEFFSFHDGHWPHFTYLKSGIIASEGGIKNIRIPSHFTGEPVIFFRYNEQRSGIDNAKWTVSRSLEGNEVDIYTIRGFYQLLVVIEIENPYSSMGELEINW